MAVTILNTIKNWFVTGAKPTQAQFWDAWDSFRHKGDSVPVADVSGLDALLLAKASQAMVDAQAELIALKEKTANKGVADGYAPLNELAKIAAVYLNIVDDLTTGGSGALASAETVKQLKGLIDGINVILGSDNVNLDNVQELVDAIETVQTSLSTILINDLTTGGTTKAATAETVKTLKELIDGLDFTQDLQAVLNAGNSAVTPNGASYIHLLRQEGDPVDDFIIHETRVAKADYSAQSDFQMYSNGTVQLSGSADDKGASFNIVEGKMMLSEEEAANRTDLEFETPIANTTLKFPAKPAGTYTLATTDDVGGAYKVYTALLSQSGTNNPTATVLQNTLGGAITFSRTSAGYYDVFLGGVPLNIAKDPFKTIVFISVIDNNAATSFAKGGTILTRSLAGSLTDDILWASSYEIRVYN